MGGVLNPAAMLLPAIALAWWTVVVPTIVSILRLGCGRGRRTGVLRRIERLRVGEPEGLPLFVSSANRNYVNLLESPVLFYLSCTVLYVTGGGTELTVWLAWAYFTLRVLHSLVHVSYNRVLRRSVIFSVSIIILCALLGQATLSVTGFPVNY